MNYPALYLRMHLAFRYFNGCIIQIFRIRMGGYVAGTHRYYYSLSFLELTSAGGARDSAFSGELIYL